MKIRFVLMSAPKENMVEFLLVNVRNVRLTFITILSVLMPAQLDIMAMLKKLVSHVQRNAKCVLLKLHVLFVVMITI